MTQLIRFFFVLSFVITSCSEDDVVFNLLPEDDFPEGDYHLYSLALNYLSENKYISDSEFIIQQPTSKYSYSNGEYDRVDHHLCNWYFKLNESFYYGYNLLQSEVLNFGNKFSLILEYSLLTQEEYDFYFDSLSVGFIYDTWKDFKENRGDGFFHLNRIHYNENRNYAIFEISYACGPLCGYGFIVDADKIEGDWEICVMYTWIS